MVTAPRLFVLTPKSLSVWKVMLTKKWRIVMAAPLTISTRTRQGLSMGLLSPRHDKTGRQDIEDAERHEDLPAQVHDLVVAEARIRPAGQDLKPAEEQDLEVEGQDPQDGHAPRRHADPSSPGKRKAPVEEPGHLPAAEKEGGRKGGQDD